MSNIHILYVGTDTVLQLDSLQNEIGGTFLANATVVVTLADDQGNEVAGATWPQSMVHVAGSKGVYRTTLPFSLGLVADRRYVAQVVADAGPGLHAEWKMECIARDRT